MIESIDQILYSPWVKGFVFAHPVITWEILTVLFTVCLALPIHLFRPKKK